MITTCKSVSAARSDLSVNDVGSYEEREAKTRKACERERKGGGGLGEDEEQNFCQMQAEALPVVNTIVLEERVNAVQLGHFGQQTDLLRTRKFLRITSHIFQVIASKIYSITSVAAL